MIMIGKKMKKRNYIFLLLLVISFFSLVGCGGEDAPAIGNANLAVKKYDKLAEQDDLGNVTSYDFNRDLFYINSLDFEVADPSIIYAEHGEGKGYFYVFGTSDQIMCHGFQCWRSKDLANWEYTGVALQPEPHDTWAANNYFAPEVIYDESVGLYYMFYSANRIDSNGQSCLSVAYSENVMGPYITPNNRTNLDGTKLFANKPVIDFEENKDLLPEDVEWQNIAIDANPFIDPVTKEKYLYWSWHLLDYSGEHAWGELALKQRIYGMKMKDWFTPDYTTVTKLTENSKVTVDGDETIDEGDPKNNYDLNEGPHMLYDKESGKYLLTFSVNRFDMANYQVRLAVSDDPLSGFEKIQPEDGGVVISTDPNWKHMASAGHHCFFNVGEQSYIGYHTFLDRASIQQGRALAIEEFKIVNNSKGVPTIHTNGPTWSLQPIPAQVSGYKNVAPEATISASNVDSKSDVKYLTDGLIKIKESDLAKETSFTDKTKITFTFKEAKELSAIMVHNSYIYENSIAAIDSIQLEYVVDAKGNTNTTTIKKVLFDFEFNSVDNEDMKPGSAAIAEFEGVPVKKVTMTISAKDCCISEIKLLAKEDSNMKYKSSFATSYSYNNKVNLNHFLHEGTVLGGTDLYGATYGWDFSHENGDSNSYVTTKGLSESYVYFKDVVGTKFYAEGYISTTSLEAYPIEYKDADTGGIISKPIDDYPKMGMVVRTKNAAFYFYIDAANSYSKPGVGFAQSVLGKSGQWDWSITEITKTFTEIDSKLVGKRYANDKLNLNDNYLKLAILRDGSKFYMFLNDVLVFEDTNEKVESGASTVDKTRVFIQDFVDNKGNPVPASIGFLGFSSPMIVKNYSIITNSSAVDQKLAELK